MLFTLWKSLGWHNLYFVKEKSTLFVHPYLKVSRCARRTEIKDPKANPQQTSIKEPKLSSVTAPPARRIPMQTKQQINEITKPITTFRRNTTDPGTELRLRALLTDNDPAVAAPAIALCFPIRCWFPFRRCQIPAPLDDRWCVRSGGYRSSLRKQTFGRCDLRRSFT